eukprot:g12704.t1
MWSESILSSGEDIVPARGRKRRRSIVRVSGSDCMPAYKVQKVGDPCPFGKGCEGHLKMSDRALPLPWIRLQCDVCLDENVCFEPDDPKHVLYKFGHLELGEPQI